MEKAMEQLEHGDFLVHVGLFDLWIKHDDLRMEHVHLWI